MFRYQTNKSNTFHHASSFIYNSLHFSDQLFNLHNRLFFEIVSKQKLSFCQMVRSLHDGNVRWAYDSL